MSADEAGELAFDRHRLRTHRHHARLSAASVARACGVTKIHFRNWENGRGRPGIDRLPLLAATLGLTRIDDLFGPITQTPSALGDPVQCAGKTAGSGFTEQCKNDALRGSPFCSLHDGQAGNESE
ncbi:MAG TPA: helix-turn-helix transcriptional regulator [Actinophytocola sp.]|nr:helix-turn-helix transcriptional regulator [Actinophytocola sp.]